MLLFTPEKMLKCVEGQNLVVFAAIVLSGCLQNTVLVMIFDFLFSGKIHFIFYFIFDFAVIRMGKGTLNVSFSLTALLRSSSYSLSRI
jgi:hypothetical protein